jgi:hypothetical protein
MEMPQTHCHPTVSATLLFKRHKLIATHCHVTIETPSRPNLSQYVEDCKALQADIDSVPQWCVENCMELKMQKNKLYLLRVKPTAFILIAM